MEFSYHPNGSKKTVTISSTDSLGKTSDTRYEYEENGKMNYAEKSYFRRGVYVEEKYEGTNLENRVAGGVASEVIEYNDEGKTAIKQRIVNIFDEDGILIGDETYSKEGEKISEHDFSELDGKFDTAYQKGRGDCYLLAAINSLAGSEAGSKMLENIISQENGNFVIKFPGAKIARERLIKDLKAKNPKLDVSKINIPDKYTITAEELKQAMLKSGVKYSIGDKDVLLLEIAYEKYRESVVETLDENNLKPSDYMKGFSLNLDGDDYLSAGTGSEAIFILTGQKSEVYITKDYKKTPVCYIDSDFQMHITTPSGKLENANIINKIISATNSAESNKLIEKLKKATKDGVIQNYAATAGLKVSSQEVNGKVIKGGNHAFTIKSVTDDKVILANPWNPDVDVVMSMEDFLKAAYMIEVADVSKADNTPSNSPADGVGGEDGNQPVAPSSPTNQNGTIYTVPARKGYTTLIKEKLIEQGIEPTPENIQKAKAQFKAANPGAVKVYNGVKRAWRGNEYLLKGAEVNIPQFKTDADGNVL